jgi:hypothetical protein
MVSLSIRMSVAGGWWLVAGGWWVVQDYVWVVKTRDYEPPSTSH